jgi:putative spermidine/putrescine transport system substrate-binding protein
MAALTCTDQQSLTVVSYGGGVYQESHIQAFVVPFEETYNVKVQAESWNANLTELRKRVTTGDPVWQVVEVTDAQFRQGLREGLFENLSVPAQGDFLAGTRHQRGIANIYWGTVLAFDPEDFHEGKMPTRWRDFWDVINFPGARGLQDDPRGTLEFALLADGIPIEALYPLDVDRAFRKLDELKPHITEWWKEGGEAIEALTSNRVQLTSAWNGRVFAARRKGSRIAYSWHEAALDLDWWVVPRGTRNRKLASEFIAFASTAGRQADLAQRVGYGPVNLDALRLLPPEVREELPTYRLNWEKAFIMSSDWWSIHEEEMADRWKDWRSRGG